MDLGLADFPAVHSFRTAPTPGRFDRGARDSGAKDLSTPPNAISAPQMAQKKARPLPLATSINYCPGSLLTAHEAGILRGSASRQHYS